MQLKYSAKVDCGFIYVGRLAVHFPRQGGTHPATVLTKKASDTNHPSTAVGRLSCPRMGKLS